MKRYFRFLLLAFAATSLCCCSSGQKVKPKPPEGDWVKCPICKGTGCIESLNSEEPADDIHDRDEEKDESNSGCLGSIFHRRIKNYESKVEKIYPDTRTDINMINKDYKQKNLDDIPEKATVKRKVTCPRCRGTGWVEFSEKNHEIYEFDRDEHETLQKIKKKINQ